jgi:aquaporin Z
MDFRKYAAELLGSFLFFTIGYLSVAAFGAAGASGLLVVPFSFGFGLLAAIFAFGHISGGHFNPAVTVAMVLDKRTTPVDGVGYIVAQVIGAVAAGLFVMAAVSQQAVANGTTKPNSAAGITDLGALLIETVMTAGFIAVILASTKRAPALAALAIPLSLVAIHFATASLSGASVNPARSIGSAVVGGEMSALWIYIVAPVVGAVLGWVAWKVIDGGVKTIPAEEPGAEHLPD